MRYISSGEAKRTFPEVFQLAQRGPVTIRDKNRNIAVILAPEEFAQFEAQRAALMQQFLQQILPDESPSGGGRKKRPMLRARRRAAVKRSRQNTAQNTAAAARVPASR